MSPDVAEDVYPIIGAGLALWRSGAAADAHGLPPEWGGLRELIRRADEKWAAARTRAPAQFEQEAVGFPGIGFPLACWLDELFVLNSPWGGAWNESKLEASLYGTNKRAVQFWRVALAAERFAGAEGPAADAAEVCFLCVALGFRGEWATDAQRLANWQAAVRDKLRAVLGGPQPPAPGREYPTAVPPRLARRWLRGLTVFGGVLLLLTMTYVLPRMAGFVGFFPRIVGLAGSR